MNHRLRVASFTALLSSLLACGGSTARLGPSSEEGGPSADTTAGSDEAGATSVSTSTSTTSGRAPDDTSSSTSTGPGSTSTEHAGVATTSTVLTSSTAECSHYLCADDCAFGHAPVPGCPGTSCDCNPSPLDGGPDSSMNDPRCPEVLTNVLYGAPCSVQGVTCTYGTGTILCAVFEDGGADEWNDPRCPVGAPQSGTPCPMLGAMCQYEGGAFYCLGPSAGPSWSDIPP